MNKVLVTGATGFIGRHAIPKLLKKGYEVHTISSKPSHTFPSTVHAHTCNLLDSNQVNIVMSKIRPTHLLHFAWDATPGKFWTSPNNLEWVKASLHLLQQFIEHRGKRVVMSGSCAEYDWNHDLCHETTPLTPATLYGTCKASLSQMFSAYSRQMNISSAWGRIFFLYGPHEYPQRLVPTIINHLLRGEIAKCSHGMQIRDFMHVEDIADAFVALLDSEIQGAINIASGHAISLKYVIDQIAGQLDARQLVHLGAIPPAATDAPKIVADTNRLSQELNWQPKYSLDNGLSQTIEWWKNFQSTGISRNS